nr:glutathione S-transferase N-terminal domain-containing protein [Deltaproteobacteria bacterium]
MTLVLHQLPPLDRAPSLSPFCTKVETYLRMTGVAYRSVPTLDASSGPKGKLPFIEDDGRRLGDSRLIIEHLKRTRGDALDAHLDARARAVAVGFERMMDEHLYWAIVHSRWLDERFAPRMH